MAREKCSIRTSSQSPSPIVLTSKQRPLNAERVRDVQLGDTAVVRRPSQLSMALAVLCLALSTFAFAGPALGSTVYTAPRPTGEIDDGSLARFIASVPDGSTIVLRADAVYRLDKTLAITRRWDLTIDGNGATLKWVTDGGENRRHVKVLGGGNIVIEHLTVRGANPDAGLSKDAWDRHHAFQHAFQFNAVQGAVLDGVQAYDVYGDFVYISANADLVPSRDISIVNSTFDRNGRQGIAIGSAEHVVIQNNTIANVRQAVIDIEPMSTDWHVDDVVVQNNVLGPRRISILSAASRGPVSNVSFLDNGIVGVMRVIVEAKVLDETYSGFTFTNNVATQRGNSGGAIMGFTRAENIYLAGNTFGFTPRSHTDLMNLNTTSHVLVENNSLIGVDKIFNVNTGCSDYVERNNVI